MEAVESLTAQIDRLNDQISALENDRDRLEREVEDLEKECASYMAQAESVDRVKILHDGMRELGFDLGAEDAPYAVTTTTHRMRLASALRRAGHEAE
jgi:predicted nuclease with TOPRIM domain